MNTRSRIYTLTLLIGDVALFYVALWITIALKYTSADFYWVWAIHKTPFTIVFVIWAILFFVAGLYDQTAWTANGATRERIIRTMIVSAIIAIILFYLIPSFGITPKTNLLIQAALSFGFILLWRMLFSAVVRTTSPMNILFLGASEEMRAFAAHLKANPHIGYNITSILDPAQSNENTLENIVRQKRISLVIASADIHAQKEFVRMIYDVLPLGIRFVDFPTFYETITGKIPISLISEMWFLENITEHGRRMFSIFKRILDIIFTILLGIAALVLAPFIAAAILLETKGHVIIRQTRAGKNGVPFTLYKFRSMVRNAEQNGAAWASTEDPRITRVGSVLRHTRLDELPQLINILRGEMSFVGPRPERPEFIETLKNQIPFYDIRHLVQPGLSGWAQINFPYGASVEDAMEKLQYDLYYIKNRSLALDVTIALKTILVMLSRGGR